MERKLPNYCHHKRANQAYVTLPLGNGKRQVVYLGIHNSRESLEKYDKVVGGWLATKKAPQQDSGPTVASVAERYKSDRRKANDNKRYHLDAAIKFLVELFPERPAKEFDALQMNRLRSELINREYSRKYCNDILVTSRRKSKVGRTRR